MKQIAGTKERDYTLRMLKEMCEDLKKWNGDIFTGCDLKETHKKITALKFFLDDLFIFENSPFEERETLGSTVEESVRKAQNPFLEPILEKPEITTSITTSKEAQ